MSYTPGQWEAVEFFADDSDESLGLVVQANDRAVASLPGISRTDFANAHLIAAAPEMLAALYAALPFVEDCQDAPEYKPGTAARVVSQILRAIEAADA